MLASARLTDPQTWNRYAYVRNNPVNFIDPDGRMIWGAVSELQYLMSMAWNPYAAANKLYALPNIGGSNPYWGNMDPSYFMYMMAQAEFNAYQYQLYLAQQYQSAYEMSVSYQGSASNNNPGAAMQNVANGISRAMAALAMPESSNNK